MNARRMALRRGAAAIAAMFVAGAQKKLDEDHHALPYGPPRRASLDDDAVDAERRELSEPLRKQQRKNFVDRRHRVEAWYEQDHDLTVLHSTTQSWRYGIMRGRLARQQTVADLVSERIDAIWSEPLEKIRSAVAAWIRGDA